MKILSSACSAVAALALMAGAASAHSVWIAQRHGVEAVVYGHGASDDSYDPAKVTSLVARAADGSAVKLSMEKHSDHVTFTHDEAAATVVIEFDNGYWSMDADKEWHNLPKDEVANARQGGHYVKYAVSYLQPSEGEIKPQGLKFEIVPLQDPLAAKMGDALPVQVLFDGAPAADVSVIAEYVTDSETIAAKTDADGKAVIEIRNQGLNVVAAAYDEEVENDPKADKIGYMASMSFTLKGGH